MQQPLPKPANETLETWKVMEDEKPRENAGIFALDTNEMIWVGVLSKGEFIPAGDEKPTAMALSAITHWKYIYQFEKKWIK